MNASLQADPDRLLQKVVAGTAGDIGEGFFRALVKHLGEALGVRYAFVAVFPGAPDCVQKDRVQTLAWWSRDGYLDNIEYPIAGSPCELVLAGETRLFCDNVAALFPAEEEELRALGAVSYLAMPLFDTRGEVMGHLAVIDDKPMQERPGDLSLLRVFGARTAAELERRAMDESLRRSEARLKSILESTHDAIVVVDGAGQVTLCNPAAEALFARKADIMLGAPLDRLLTTPFTQLKQGCFGHSAAAGGRPASLWAPQGIQARRASGEAFPVELTISPSTPVADDGQPQLFTLILRDLASREAADRELKRLRLTASYLRAEVEQAFDLDGMVTRAPRMQKVLANVQRVAPTDSTVLLTGETGVGKELMARAIHRQSRRADKPLIKINCAALPAELIESELFGHEAGAFTGAVSKRIGRFELADGGTLFLDEVGELTAAAQAKLLRVLQEQEFERVGGSRSIRVDVRVVAATNRDLGAMATAGEFRGDLYYRLNVFPVRIPPLRERREDIPPLARHFLARNARDLGRALTDLTPDSMDRLLGYPWPGNVRELQNVIERAAILADGPLVSIQDVLEPARQTAMPAAPATPEETTTQAVAAPLAAMDAERAHLQAVLEQTDWTIEGEQGAARLLQLAPSTLRSRMKKLGIRRS
ncbi:sigma 54-interacting transcriptional regulator [Thiohalocapsa sp.]|uniref:sigma 54-interacting transcriptional regulator n=1 Tax=Thiohalocapsa sp. TaxID=2497641 RepID=UPI0025E75A3C|nr:sigma 54-interacting transcriptional regulator [Thiohalocapsa sp.]